MPRDLVILERPVPKERWQWFREEVGADRDIAVLANTQSLFALEDPSNGVTCVDADISTEVWRELWDQVIHYVGQWDDGPLGQVRGDLEYQGIDLWDATHQLRCESYAFPLFTWVHSLSRILVKRTWERVHLIGDSGILDAVFQAVAQKIAFQGEVIRWPQVSQLNWKGRLADKLGAKTLSNLWPGRSRPLPDFVQALRGAERPVFSCLTYTSHRAYVDTALPVMKRLREVGHVFSIDDGGVNNALLSKAGFDIVSLSQHVPLQARPGIIRKILRLRRIWRRLCRDSRFQSQFDLDGVDLWPSFAIRLELLFNQVFPKMIADIEGARRLFAATRSKAILAIPDSSITGVAALKAGRQLGVPSLAVQPAIYGDNASFREVYADRVAVIDDVSKQLYTKHARLSSERLQITGLPRWDSIFELDQKAGASAVRQTLGIEMDERIVVYATQWFPIDHTRKMIQCVLNAISKCPGTTLVIKVHPAETAQKYETLVDSMEWQGARPIVAFDIPLYPLLAASEMLVTGNSNVALEAALLDKRVLTINLTKDSDIYPFAKQGIALGAYSKAEAEDLCFRLLRDPDTIERLRQLRHAYYEKETQMADGEAAARVAELLQRMANS